MGRRSSVPEYPQWVWKMAAVSKVALMVIGGGFVLLLLLGSCLAGDSETSEEPTEAVTATATATESVTETATPSPEPEPEPEPAAEPEPEPAPAPEPEHPEGATALCSNGTYSWSENRRGTCSHHGGVAQWL